MTWKRSAEELKRTGESDHQTTGSHDSGRRQMADQGKMTDQEKKLMSQRTQPDKGFPASQLPRFAVSWLLASPLSV